MAIFDRGSIQRRSPPISWPCARISLTHWAPSAIRRSCHREGPKDPEPHREHAVGVGLLVEQRSKFFLRLINRDPQDAPGSSRRGRVHPIEERRADGRSTRGLAGLDVNNDATFGAGLPDVSPLKITRENDGRVVVEGLPQVDVAEGPVVISSTSEVHRLCRGRIVRGPQLP